MKSNFYFDFLVELHPDNVLEVILVVEFISNETCMYINTKGRSTEKFMMNILKMAEIFNFLTFRKNEL